MTLNNSISHSKFALPMLMPKSIGISPDSVALPLLIRRIAPLISSTLIHPQCLKSCSLSKFPKSQHNVLVAFFIPKFVKVYLSSLSNECLSHLCLAFVVFHALHLVVLSRLDWPVQYLIFDFGLWFIRIWNEKYHFCLHKRLLCLLLHHLMHFLIRPLIHLVLAFHQLCISNLLASISLGPINVH